MPKHTPKEKLRRMIEEELPGPLTEKQKNIRQALLLQKKQFTPASPPLKKKPDEEEGPDTNPFHLKRILDKAKRR